MGEGAGMRLGGGTSCLQGWARAGLAEARAPLGATHHHSGSSLQGWLSPFPNHTLCHLPGLSHSTATPLAHKPLRFYLLQQEPPSAHTWLHLGSGH